ncbi:hypothetical protein V8B97DRAFT_1542325 [Scleroderma yunnanense]
MGIVQDGSTLSNNPFIPPPDGSSPISRLPPEILSHIFEHGVLSEDDAHDSDEISAQFWNDFGDMDKTEHEGEDGDLHSASASDSDWESEESDSDESDDADDCPPFQILVSHVSRHWRTVALETPSLWTRIDVSYDDRPPYGRVATYLERSKSLPLHIRIDFEPPDDDFYVDEEGPRPLFGTDILELFMLLIPYVPRWGSVRVDVTSYEHMYTFLETISAPSIPPATQLQVLQLYHHEDMETDEPFTFAKPELSTHFTPFGGFAPHLRNVALWGVHIDWSLPWLRSAPNLTDLELAFHSKDVRPSWAAFSAMLRGAPALETLSLRASGPSGPPLGWIIDPSVAGWSEGINSPIFLGNLSELDLAFMPPFHAISLLRKLCTPTLKKLTLDFDDGDYTDFVTQLAGPATLMAPLSSDQPRSLLRSLESLKVAGLPCSDDSVNLLYRELVNLKSLNLSLTYLPRSFIQALFETPYTILPALTTLYVSGIAGEDLRRLVSQRKSAGVPLITVYMEESSEIAPDDVIWLRDNLEVFDFFEGSDDEDVDVIGSVAEDEANGDWSDVE